MNRLPSQHFRRRTALAMLALWLFALSAGWVHACLLQQRGTHVHSEPSNAAVAAHGVVVLAGHIGADSAHDDQGSGASPAGKACLKVCDDGAQTVVKLTSGFFFDPADAAMAPPVATIRVAQAAALASAPAELRAAAPPGAGPPLRTRYSRLAL